MRRSRAALAAAPLPSALRSAAILGRVVIGGIACRLEAVPAPAEGGGGPSARLYIMTLGVLAPYRGEGVGSALLRRALDECAGDEAIRYAYLHVHSGNEEAVRFYERFDFRIHCTVPGYYRKLSPPDAVELRLTLAAPRSGGEAAAEGGEAAPGAAL
jgi:ribosomal protein S18 acetylase RimI-like enzyme